MNKSQALLKKANESIKCTECKGTQTSESTSFKSTKTAIEKLNPDGDPQTNPFTLEEEDEIIKHMGSGPVKSFDSEEGPTSLEKVRSKWKFKKEIYNRRGIGLLQLGFIDNKPAYRFLDMGFEQIVIRS